jgi:GT2 family glycosyltransferase
MNSLATSDKNLDVAVILVNFRGCSDTLECLESLLQMWAPGQLHVLVTDNASGDASVERIQSWLQSKGLARTMESSSLPATFAQRVAGVQTVEVGNGSFTLICNRANDGFAAANNLGMNLARQLFDPRFFWILNNDTLVRQDTLEHLLDRMAPDPEVGICGASLLYNHAPETVQAYGGVHYSFWTGRGWHIGSGQKLALDTDPAPIEAALSYVSGASMLVSRAFVNAIGLMNETYFLYNEELDWAWRARGRFRLAWAPKAVVYHKEGATIGTVSMNRPASLLSEFYQARNKLKFTTRYTPWCLPTVWLFLAAKALRTLWCGHRRNALVIFSALVGTQKPAAWWTTQRKT